MNVDLFPASDQRDIRGAERMMRHRDRIKGRAVTYGDPSVVLRGSEGRSTIWKTFCLLTFSVFEHEKEFSTNLESDLTYCSRGAAQSIYMLSYIVCVIAG
jgi:Ribonuclease G/E